MDTKNATVNIFESSPRPNTQPSINQNITDRSKDGPKLHVVDQIEDQEAILVSGG